MVLTKKEIFNRLASAPGVYRQNDIQLRLRCFICGDSAKNENKKRLGLKIDHNRPDEPILYNCFNCFSQGVFTPDMLQNMGIHDNELYDSIKLLNKKALFDDGTKVNRYKNNKEIEIKLPPLYSGEKYISKAKYVFNRIGCVINPEEFDSLRIVWSLKDLLCMNNISIDDRNINNIELLDRDYVGFLSVLNEYIAFRDITEHNKFRWIKYNLFNVYDNSQGFYNMKGSIDLLAPDDIHMVIAEGPFDVLSLRYNVFNNDIHNKIIISSNNGSFINPLMYYIKKGIVGSNIKIDCYQDNDTILNFRDIRSQLKPFIINNDNFTVYYNELSKDFGVPKDKILINTRRI